VRSPDARQPVFYYDLGSPLCYLAAERVLSTLPVVPEWEPVLAADLGLGASSPDRLEIEARAEALGLQPLRWPVRWPSDAREATLAATYAKRVGRAVAFSLAAYRQEFAGGRQLGDQTTVLIAGAACEMHPTALLRGIGLRSTAAALEQANQRAREAGIPALPAIQCDGQVFAGEASLEDATAALGGRR
jgi:2-hydroxychromene-2-carboxylate isomerase